MPVCAREPAMVCAMWFRSSCGRVVDDAYGVRPELADEAADRRTAAMSEAPPLANAPALASTVAKAPRRSPIERLSGWGRRRS